jgi:hypothetical protein
MSHSTGGHVANLPLRAERRAVAGLGWRAARFRTSSIEFLPRYGYDVSVFINSSREVI